MPVIISLHAPDGSAVLVRADTIALVHRPRPHVDDVGAIVVDVRETVAAVASILGASGGAA